MCAAIFRDGKLGLDFIRIHRGQTRIHAGTIRVAIIYQRRVNYRFSIPHIQTNYVAGFTQGVVFWEYFIQCGIFINRLGKIIYTRSGRHRNPGNWGNVVGTDDTCSHRKNVETRGYREKYGNPRFMRHRRKFLRAIDGGIFPGQISHQALLCMGAGGLTGIICRSWLFVMERIFKD